MDTKEMLKEKRDELQVLADGIWSYMCMTADFSRKSEWVALKNELLDLEKEIGNE